MEIFQGSTITYVKKAFYFTNIGRDPLFQSFEGSFLLWFLYLRWRKITAAPIVIWLFFVLLKKLNLKNEQISMMKYNCIGFCSNYSLAPYSSVALFPCL
jgi:hypothetical protein